MWGERRGLLLSLSLTAMLLGGLGFLPLLGGPRYEAGLLAGCLVPFLAACSASKCVARRRELERSLSEVAREGLVVGALHAVVILLVAFLHGLWGGFCEPLDGFAFLLLAPCTGAVLAGLWGAAVGAWGSARNTRRARIGRAALASSLPLLQIVLGFFEFYATPAVFVFSPFVGFFAGPLYETVEYPIQRLVLYRLGSLVTILLVLLLARFFGRGASHVRWVARPRVLDFVCILVLTGMSLSSFVFAERFRLRSTAAGIEEGLGGLVRAGRCEIVYGVTSIPESRVSRLARDCDAHLSQIGRYFEIEPPARVRVYLFESETEKARWIGVARTYIAKPWRHEIYVQEAGFPHPVLGHELAHVVTGEMGRGPFRIAGHGGGLLPDPGRIEGFAVAASPREDTDASLFEWSRAMLELGRLPPVERLFQLGFLSESAARSYTVAGAFVEFVRGRFGAATLRAWYGGASLEELTGASIEELGRQFQGVLREIELAPEILAEAAQRFSGVAVFERRCPHLADRLMLRAESACGISTAVAERETQEVLRLDPTRKELGLRLSRCWLMEGKLDQAEQAAARWSEGDSLPAWMRREALVRRGDVAWARGDFPEARAAFDRALSLSPAPSGRRPIELKRWAIEQPDEAVRATLFEIFVSSNESAGQGAFLLGEWFGRSPDDPLAVYLLGKNLLARGAAVAALPHLRRASELELSLPGFGEEAARSRLIAACQLEDKAEIRRALRHLLARVSFPSRREEALRMAERAGVSLTAEERPVPLVDQSSE